MQPFKDRYLYNVYKNGQQVGGRITYVRLFTAVAFFILLIASINFMNLATARSTKRAKEVGVKKVVGSNRLHLFLQFMTESLMLAVFSAFVAGLLIAWIIEPLNLLVGKEMTFSLVEQIVKPERYSYSPMVPLERKQPLFKHMLTLRI